MNKKMVYSLCLALTLLVANLQAAETLRLDYFHTGGQEKELFSVDELVHEPLPFAGNPDHPIDKLNRGKYRFKVVLEASNATVFSHSYSSIYGEWETTGEAQKQLRTFHESLRFPNPGQDFQIKIEKRDQRQEFNKVWQQSFKVNDYMQPREKALYREQVLNIHHSGDPQHKVDLLILGDGYTGKEQKKFADSANAMAKTLLATYPFSEHKNDFNIWALAPEAKQSGVARPSLDRYIDSPLGAQYDAFRSERYILTFDNKKWRQVASSAPYDAVIIITNSDIYGGGGIYGLFSTAAANSEWAGYLFVHEFGHHFAGLADEYFTSSVAYQAPQNIEEPYEPNVTALKDPKKLKWRHLLSKGVQLPTPWPKSRYEEHAIAYQKIRAKLRADRKPEAEMDQLFRQNQEWVEKLFKSSANANKIGAFEGANYQSKGFYRSQMNCIMFTRTKDFCAVCAEAIEQMIDAYTGEGQ